MTYAETLGHYWKTSTKRPETWLKDAVKLIQGIGGVVTKSVVATNEAGRTGFMLEFRLGNDQFRLTWQALPSKTGNDFAASVQAATLLYHDVKHKVVMAKVKGTQAAFLEYLLLPDNSTVTEAVQGRHLMVSSGAAIPLPAPKK